MYRRPGADTVRVRRDVEWKVTDSDSLTLDLYTPFTPNRGARIPAVIACARKSVDDLPPALPLFIARAGRDEISHLNESLDRFVAKALARNLPITFVNHAEGPHAFGVADDSESSRDIIRLILAFLRRHLLV